LRHNVLQHSFHALQVGDLRLYVREMDGSNVPCLSARLVTLVDEAQQPTDFL
jgi:hypothetical protein